LGEETARKGSGTGLFLLENDEGADKEGNRRDKGNHIGIEKGAGGREMKYEPLKERKKNDIEWLYPYLANVKIEPMDVYIYGVKFTPEQFEVISRVVEEVEAEVKEDFKSAVQGLLQEIEKIKESLNESIKQAEREDDRCAKYDFWFALDIVEQIEEKIKKWFADVISGEEEE